MNMYVCKCIYMCACMCIIYTVCSYQASAVKLNMIFSCMREYTTCIEFSHEVSYLLVYINDGKVAG